MARRASRRRAVENVVLPDVRRDPPLPRPTVKSVFLRLMVPKRMQLTVRPDPHHRSTAASADRARCRLCGAVHNHCCLCKLPRMSQPVTATTVTIIGAGLGGIALVANLGLLGYRLRLHDRDEARIARVREHGGLDVEGLAKGFASLELVTPRLEPASGDRCCRLQNHCTMREDVI